MSVVHRKTPIIQTKGSSRLSSGSLVSLLYLKITLNRYPDPTPKGTRSIPNTSNLEDDHGFLTRGLERIVERVYIPTSQSVPLHLSVCSLYPSLTSNVQGIVHPDKPVKYKKLGWTVDRVF